MYKFEKLEVWNIALDYLDRMYSIAGALPDSEAFNLTAQLRRAATSIALNIAEGSTGQTNAEQSRFLGMALRSLMETVACLQIIRRRGYIEDSSALDAGYQQSQILARKLHAFRQALSPGKARLRENLEEYGNEFGEE
ncbi:MAG: four helix bundle protein [Anaerolineae bacterium]